jgi:hypothetical protein
VADALQQQSAFFVSIRGAGGRYHPTAARVNREASSQDRSGTPPMAMDGQNIAGKRRPSGDGVGDGGSVCKSGRWHQNGAKMRHFAGLLGPHRHPGKRRGFLPAWIFCAKPFFSGFATTVVLFVTIQGQWGRYVCCSLKKFRFSRVHNSEGYHTATAPCLALFCLPGAGGRGGGSFSSEAAQTALFAGERGHLLAIPTGWPGG